MPGRRHPATSEIRGWLARQAFALRVHVTRGRKARVGLDALYADVKAAIVRIEGLLHTWPHRVYISRHLLCDAIHLILCLGVEWPSSCLDCTGNSFATEAVQD